MADLVFRYLAHRDRGLAAGTQIRLTAALPVSTDARQATRNWADEGILALWCDEACDEIPAGATFAVVGDATLQHHGASALDLQLPVLVLAADGTDVDSDSVTRATLLIRLALASAEVAPDGRDYASPLPR